MTNTMPDCDRRNFAQRTAIGRAEIERSLIEAAEWTRRSLAEESESITDAAHFRGARLAIA